MHDIPVGISQCLVSRSRIYMPARLELNFSPFIPSGNYIPGSGLGSGSDRVACRSSPVTLL